MSISFSALVKIPGSEYFNFNAALVGIATVDSISREGGDSYHANIDFDVADLPKCIGAVTSCEGEVVEIVQNKTYDKMKATAPKVAKAVTKYIGNKRASDAKIGELATHMKTWKTAKELMEEAGITSSTFYYRLAKLKKAKRLQVKEGTPGGVVQTQYKIKSAA